MSVEVFVQAEKKSDETADPQKLLALAEGEA